MKFLLSTGSYLLGTLLLTACTQEQQPQRWYTESQITYGETVFNQHCMSCHGAKAAGLGDNWQQQLPDKDYSPPALNGSAHAWHHPLDNLKRTITRGTQPIGGYMPAFGETLSEDDKLAVIAYFQSFWSEETYAAWKKRSSQ